LEYEAKLWAIFVNIPPELARDKEERQLFFELACGIANALANIEQEDKRKANGGQS